MSRSLRTAFPLIALFLVGTGAVEAAETSAEALKQEIQRRSQHIEEFRTLLNDPDQTVRLAALDVMLKGDDIAMRELAYGICFSSADQAMRSVCLKNRFADLTTVGFTITSTETPTGADEKQREKQQQTVEDWGSVYSFDIAEYDEKTGRFSTSGSYKQGSGQITGTTLVLTQAYCTGTLKLADGGVLEGKIGCRGSWKGTYLGYISLL